MLSRQQVREITERIARQSPPVLSLYANVNPARSENNPKANSLRVKESLKRLNAPGELIAEASAIVADVPQARTIAVFGRPGALETLPLQVEVPVISPTAPVDAHWGEPYTTPLELAFDEYERYAVVYVDSQRFRLFELFLGEIEEVSELVRPPAPGADDRLSHAKQTSPAFIASRDSAGRDRIARRMDQWTHRFYKSAAQELESVMRDRGMDRLILIGRDENVSFFEGVMSKALHERVVARLPSLSSPDAAVSEVLDRVESEIEAIEAREEAILLDRIRERGAWGVERCLEELQQGRVQVIAVPYNLDREAFVVPELDFVTTQKERASKQADGRTVEKRPLIAILPEICSTHGARVEFLRGDNAERVARELGGMAALLRW